jgi:hypothetical protein
MLSSYRARFVASRLPRSIAPHASGLAAAATALPQVLCGGPLLLAARVVRTVWAPRVSVVRSHSGPVSVSGSGVCARRGAGGVGARPGEADESRSLTVAERAAIDSAAERMAHRATEEGEWDCSLDWDGIDSWAKVRCLGSALERCLHESDVPTAKTDDPLAYEFRRLAFRHATVFDLEAAQYRVARCVDAYRQLLPTFLKVFKEKATSASFADHFGLEMDDEWASRVLVVNKHNAGAGSAQRVVTRATAIRSQFVCKVQEKLRHDLVVVTGESGAGKTFGAVMAAAQSADNAAVLYFSDFDGVRQRRLFASCRGWSRW